MVYSSEISSLSHSFAETILVNTRSIFRKWRRFFFLKGQSTKTYLTFYTCITKSEISACLHSLCFSLCKVLFLTSFFAENIVNNGSWILGNWESFISKKFLSTLTSFIFYISILDWYIQVYHWTLSLQNFWGRMQKGRMQLVTGMLHHQLRVAIKFEFVFFVIIIP